jgi:1-acyl-sn-glycerol-3-phosphate acyltransferase
MYLSHPPWSDYSRRGRMDIEFRWGFSAGELRKLTVDEIYRKLVDMLWHDDWEFQKDHRVRYRSPRRAELVEKLLFMCPDCRSVSSFRSHKSDFHCSVCGHASHYSELGFLEPRRGNRHFHTVADWNEWQLGALRKRLETAVGDDAEGGAPQSPIFSDDAVALSIGYRDRPLEPAGYGRLTLFTDRIEFQSKRSESFTFPISDIRGQNVQVKERVEWYYKQRVYVFGSRRSRLSGLKWLATINFLQDLALPEDDQRTRPGADATDGANDIILNGSPVLPLRFAMVPSQVAAPAPPSAAGQSLNA